MTTYILTCDKMIDNTMNMIEHSFGTYWPESDITVLGYKSPKKMYENIKFESLGKDLGPGHVCKQLFEFFSNRNEKHFIFGVDDQPLVSRVDNNMVSYAEEVMRLNETAGRFGLTSDNATRGHTVLEKIENNSLIQSLQNERYKISYTYSIWKSEYFLLYLNDYDNLWQVEIQGSEKSINDEYKILAFFTGILDHSHMFKKGKLKRDWDLSCYTKKPLMESDKKALKTIYKL